MAALLSLEVATPDGLALKTEAEMVTAPSVEGEFGVLPGHLPLLAATRAGLLKYRVSGRDEIAAIGPGFVEARPDKVLVLTDAFMTPASIDKPAAEKDLAEAERAIAALKGAIDAPEHQEAQRSLEWARARVDASRAS
jgi:F-type H+-transporting ATPase subunit epsilon